MARPKKSGLEYFPIDVDFDDKMQALEMMFENDFLAWIIKFWQSAYKSADGEVDLSGLYGELLAKKARISIDKQNAILDLSRSIDFLYQTENGKWTSNGIKKRIASVSKERAEAIERKESNQQIFIIKNESTGKTLIGSSHNANQRIIDITNEFDGESLHLVYKSSRVHKSIILDIYDSYAKYREIGEWFDITKEQTTTIVNNLKLFDTDTQTPKTTTKPLETFTLPSVIESNADTYYEKLKTKYPDNGSAISEEVRRLVRSKISNGLNGDLFISSVENYTEYCKKAYPKSYPYDRRIKNAKNWINEDQFNIKWKEKISALSEETQIKKPDPCYYERLN